MKTLDLNAYGVSEMNMSELMSIEGGKWSLESILGVVLIVLAYGAFALAGLL
ncbi:hypothetical protein AGMMS50262_07450 [Bacteroidia bacterium]|nr:hypothetical protein AGMMS50262_07450 [Bacteroidia bacterium]